MAASIRFYNRYISSLCLQCHRSLPILSHCRLFKADQGQGHDPGNNNISFTNRSHLCGDLRKHHEGERVRLCGWVQYHRSSFILLRDWCGLVQMVIPKHKIAQTKDLPVEAVVEVTGQVISRPPGQENKEMSTGDIEIAVDDIKVLNSCKSLPYTVKNVQKTKEFKRLKHRYIEMRFPDVQFAFRMRSKFVMALRKYLADNNGFVEIETPTLFRRTPGGAREFIVPSGHFPGKFYSLPQSPQQFKQLLMVGGFDRYFQIARCYRDENLRLDRQPEFTQVDLEMSFVNQEDVMSMVEDMMIKCWPEDKGFESVPFPRMTYNEAMTKYGCDKPDLRLDWEITDVTDLVRESYPPVFQPHIDLSEGSIQALRIPEGMVHMTKKNLSDLKDYVSIRKHCEQVKLLPVKLRPDGTWGSGLGEQLGETRRAAIEDRLGAVTGDIIVFAGGDKFTPHRALGHARLNIATTLELKGVNVRKDGFHFLWVDTFPLFLPNIDGSAGLDACHHPFTAPHPDDIDLVYTDPEKVRSQHYDLVLNGSEIGGGSIRIHDSNLQRYILNTVLKEDSTELEHLLEALELGCPPHGGLALGLDRLVSIMLGTDSIKDVIAFPKTGDGLDPMSQAPAAVSQGDLDHYRISLVHTEEGEKQDTTS